MCLGLLFPLLLLTGCGSKEVPSVAKPTTPPVREITIAAAADLKFALEELIAEFQRQQPEFQCKVTYGSSGNFYTQLTQRAPFDLYLSADLDYPRKLIDQDLAIRETEFSYAIGHVVVWVPTASPLKIEELGIEALLDPSVGKIAIANPRHAPYGRAAEAALRKLAVYDKIEKQLVLAENVAQTAQFIESGAADVGLISLSLALAPSLRDKGRYWLVPVEAYPKLVQGGVILSWARDRGAAEHLREFLMSDGARAIFTRYGFSEPPRETET